MKNLSVNKYLLGHPETMAQKEDSDQTGIAVSSLSTTISSYYVVIYSDSSFPDQVLDLSPPEQVLDLLGI